MEKIYIFTGKGKDSNGEYRKSIEKLLENCGGRAVDDPAQADAVVALGGDGTMLHASLHAVRYGLPIIGVNLGLVGYMTEIDREEIPLLSRLFTGEYCIEERMTLSIGTPDGREWLTLNDAVIHSLGTHMVSLGLTCSGADVGVYRGDGLIFATPTGSTAYSMSAGGSVTDPHLKCICVTPICPQSLVARPMVFAPDRQLTAEVKTPGCIVTLDGGDPIDAPLGSRITVRRHEAPVRLIRLKDNEFFGVLRNKLDLFGK